MVHRTFHTDGLTPVGDYVETCSQTVARSVLLLFIAERMAVPGPDAVALLEEFPCGLFASPRVVNGLGVRSSIGTSINQHLGGNHDRKYQKKNQGLRRASMKVLHKKQSKRDWFLLDVCSQQVLSKKDASEKKWFTSKPPYTLRQRA